MILVTVELISARTGKRSILGQARICNDVKRTAQTDGVLGDYLCSLTGKKGRVMHGCLIEKFPRKRLHAWNLIYRMLDKMIGSRNR